MFRNPHFRDPDAMEITTEHHPLIGGMVVGRTPVGSRAIAMVVKGRTGAYKSVLSALASGRYDTVPWRDVYLWHDEEAHQEGGMIRAVTPYGSTSTMGTKEPGVDPERAWSVCKRALNGRIQCPWCGNNDTEFGDVWRCSKCDREEAMP